MHDAHLRVCRRWYGTRKLHIMSITIIQRKQAANCSFRKRQKYEIAEVGRRTERDFGQVCGLTGCTNLDLMSKEDFASSVTPVSARYSSSADIVSIV